MERDTRNNDAFGSQDTSIDFSNGGGDRAEGFAAVDMGDTDRDPKEILGERPKRQEADPQIAPVSNSYVDPDEDEDDEEGDEDYDDEDDDLLDDADVAPDTDAAAITDDDIDIDAAEDIDPDDLDDEDDLLVDDEDEDEDDDIITTR